MPFRVPSPRRVLLFPEKRKHIEAHPQKGFPGSPVASLADEPRRSGGLPRTKAIPVITGRHSRRQVSRKVHKRAVVLPFGNVSGASEPPRVSIGKLVAAVKRDLGSLWVTDETDLR